MNFALRVALASVAIGGLSIPASAAVVFDAVETQVINFEGFSDSFAGQATPVPGLLGQLTLKLTSGLGTNTLNFDYSVLNTSTAPMTSARITFFGFDVAGSNGGTAVDFDFDSSDDNNDATGLFSAIDTGNIPMGYPDVDICYGTGNGNNCTGGGGDPGASMNTAASTGTFRLVFDSPVNKVIFDDLYLRYQSLTNGPNSRPELNGASGVGRQVTPPGAVPEPATWAMLIAGFGLVGAAARRRRVSAVTA